MPGSGRRGQTILMHRLITGAAPGQEVDHVNRDGLDNRRANLRVATRSQQIANQDIRLDNTSGYRGVSWRRDSRRWQAQLTVNGKWRGLGCYDDPEDAARAYDAAAREHFGEFAVLNFPD